MGPLAGVFAPTLTAYDSAGTINLDATRKYVRFLLDEGVDGLTPLGSAGEPCALSLRERMDLLDAIVEENAGQVPVFAGTGDYSTASTIELSLHAKRLGCTGLMLFPPPFLKPPKKDVLLHLRRVRDAVGLPIMVYNVPSLTGIEITPDEIASLAEEDVVHAVKWSHVEVSRIHDTRLLCGPGFPIFAGIDIIAFEALAVGANGWISGLPMIVPRLAVRLHRLLTVEARLEAARKLWYELLPIIGLEYRAFGTDSGDPHWLAVCRAAAMLRGMDIGVSRPPLSALDPAASEDLRRILIDLGELQPEPAAHTHHR